MRWLPGCLLAGWAVLLVALPVWAGEGVHNADAYEVLRAEVLAADTRLDALTEGTDAWTSAMHAAIEARSAARNYLEAWLRSGSMDDQTAGLALEALLEMYELTIEQQTLIGACASAEQDHDALRALLVPGHMPHATIRGRTAAHVEACEPAPGADAPLAVAPPPRPAPSESPAPSRPAPRVDEAQRAAQPAEDAQERRDEGTRWGGGLDPDGEPHPFWGTTTPEPRTRSVRGGLDLGLLLSLGDYSEVTGPAVGLLGRFEYLVSSNGAFTVRAGYLVGVPKSHNAFGFDIKTSISHVPMLAGFKFHPGPRPSHEGGLYLAAEAGPNLMIVQLRDDDWDEHEADTDLRFAIGLGAGFETGPLDLRGGLYVPHLGDLKDSIGLMVTAGFTF